MVFLNQIFSIVCRQYLLAILLESNPKFGMVIPYFLRHSLYLLLALYASAEASKSSKQLHTFIFHYNLALFDTATKFLMLFSNIAL